MTSLHDLLTNSQLDMSITEEMNKLFGSKKSRRPRKYRRSRKSKYPRKTRRAPKSRRHRKFGSHCKSRRHHHKSRH